MKRLLLLIAALAAVAATEGRAQADFIFGTQAFGSSATVSSPGGNDVNDTDFTLNFVTLLGGSNQTDDYIGTVGSFTNTLDTTSAGGFVFGSATYGFFTVGSVLENSLISDISRTVSFSGTFAPDAATFGPGFDPTPGILTITINEASVGGGPAVLSASATLATAGPAVPAPSTIIMLMTVVGPLGLSLLRKRRVF